MLLQALELLLLLLAALLLALLLTATKLGVNCVPQGQWTTDTQTQGIPSAARFSSAMRSASSFASISRCEQVSNGDIAM